jgi:hypothetical protein
MKTYNGFIPPCAIFCGGCPVFVRKNKACLGAEDHCKKRKCKGIYVCCIEKKGLRFCYQCKTFPCSRLKKFAKSWEQYGQDLIKNQLELKELGEEKWLEKFNNHKE